MSIGSTVTISLALIILFVLSWTLLVRKIKPVDKWFLDVDVPAHLEDLDESIKTIGKNQSIDVSQYESIFRYFIEGIDSYSSKYHSRVVYPGISGTRGSVVEGLEGFARSSVLVCSWLSSGRTDRVQLTSGKTFSIKEHFLSGLISGTDPNSEEFWGHISDFDQRIAEGADIALGIWMIKNTITTEIDSSKLKSILEWLNEVNGKKIYDGNWVLFRIIINMVLIDFRFLESNSQIAVDYSLFKSFYVGNGWFTDGPGGPVDYYNVWQMQYMLFWISEINPDFDTDFLMNVFSEFSSTYKYFISPEGIPIFGRSCCYRLAAPVPLIAIAKKNPKDWGQLARRATDVTWAHFISRGALKNGTVTQGYWEQDEDLLENYSGRASPLWSLRSLVLAFYLPEEHSFWSETAGSLPIEKESYQIKIPGPKLTIRGSQNTKEVIVERKSPNPLSKFSNATTFKRMSTARRLLQYVLKRPLRHSNLQVKYGRRSYSSKNLFIH
ncbi:DUF2264 domain-containing protein [Marinobacter sp. MMG032]|uniref:DUF2264 domain-containing protein n=1 Tax=Marinobacter sp. MMG032 TaxID=3158548 RepID=A0AAU7MMB2_9GAMM